MNSINYALNMEKDKYILREINKQIQYWVSLALFFGSFFFLSLSLLDYIATPDNFTSFLKARFFGAGLFILLFFLNRRKLDRAYQLVLIYLAVISSVLIIEYMILQFGGHSSTYYAGIFILVMVVVGFIPLNIKHAISLTLIALTIYILPIVLFDKTLKFSVFIMPVSFLMATFLIANVWRYLSQERILNVLSLQFDLSQEKEQLKVYSTQLEQLVAERTKELTISEKRYRELFESANDGIVVFNENGIILDSNRQFCEMHGFEKEALIGKNMKILEPENHTGEKEDRMRRILSGEALVFETEHLRKDGSTILLEVSSKAIDIDGKTYIQSFHRDIAEKKRLQNQLFHSQKMESIGVLAGGLAHDFNNMLTSLLGHTELLLMDENMDLMSKKRLKTIENSARKAGQMVSQLLGFARKGEFLALPMNLNDALRDAIELVERVMKKKEIEVKKELNDEIPVIKGDSSQLEQVIVNLLMNAGDAMPSSGTITVSTSMKKIERNDNRYPLLKPGTYACLRISDTGTGISNEIIDRIFDPFFTTKAPGKGTGLGLAMVYGIVREHQGTIDIKSQMGKGTTFEICLPAYVGHSSV